LVAVARNNLGLALKALGQRDAARAEYEQAGLGEHDAARAELERAVGISERALGADAPETQLFRRNLAARLAV